MGAGENVLYETGTVICLWVRVSMKETIFGPSRLIETQ